VPQRKGGPKRVDSDEGPGRGDIEKIPSLKPAFQKDGTVTAGNASTINDGAAAVIVCGADVAQKRGWKPLARVVAMAQAAQAPEWFTTAPAISIERALKKAKLSTGDIDLYEINEAFAVVAIANNQLLGLDARKVNVHGGAVALGHPIGASGARLLTTLIYALQNQGKKRGVASLCIGGGEAVAMVIER
jgi:acetyl-CoA C-acetyltransferase